MLQLKPEIRKNIKSLVYFIVNYRLLPKYLKKNVLHCIVNLKSMKETTQCINKHK